MSDDVSTKGLVARADRLVARAERVDRAVAALKARFAPLLPGGEIQDTGRAIWTVSATPLLVANGVIRYDARDFNGPESERDLDSCLAVLSTYDVPWRFSAWHHLGADRLMPHLIARGMIGTESDRAMWLDLQGGVPACAEPATTAGEGGIEIRRAATAGELDLWTHICTTVFGIPNEYEDVFEVIAANPQALSAVAYADGRAVGCLSMTVEDGLALVDNFGVLPDYRRRGIGRRLLEAAQHGATARGAKACVVVATAAGTSICARLGYHEVTSVTYLMAGASADLTCDQAMAHG